MSFRRYLYGYDSYDGTGGYYAAKLRQEMEEDRIREERRRREALLKTAGDSKRRQTEARCLGRFTPAGVWDADCEKWPAQTYTLDLGGGFTARMMRNYLWSWNGYVKMPEWYPNRLRDMDFWTRMQPHAPVHHREFTHSKDGEIGWDHTWGGDLAPLGKPAVEGGTIGPNFGPHATYTTMEMVKEECLSIANWLASLVLNGHLPVPADVLTANRAGLVAIQQKHELIRERKRAERAAAEAAAKAEADRKAAEEAERQRLWDLEHPLEAALRDATAVAATAKKAADSASYGAAAAERSAVAYAEELEVKKNRPVRIREILDHIAALEARDTAGEELTAADKRQMKRKEQLERELANRVGEKWDTEEAALAALRAKAAAAQEKKVATQAAADAAAAAVTAAEAAIAKRDAEVRAAEEARVAAEKAAAEAAIAAEKAAAEREVATKRLGHVIRLLGEIDALRARRAAGERLDPLQVKKMGRQQALERERADLEAALA